MLKQIILKNFRPEPPLLVTMLKHFISPQTWFHDKIKH